MSVFLCKGCGYAAFDKAPDKCPVCGAPKSDFVQNDKIFEEYGYGRAKKLRHLFNLIESLVNHGVDMNYIPGRGQFLPIICGEIGHVNDAQQRHKHSYHSDYDRQEYEELENKILPKKIRIVESLIKTNINPFLPFGRSFLINRTDYCHHPLIKTMIDNYEDNYLLSILKDNRIYTSLLPSDLTRCHLLHFIL